jgi:hypothetical protein
MKLLDDFPRTNLFQISVWVLSQMYSGTPPLERFPMKDIWPMNTYECLELKTFVPGSHIVYAYGEEAFVGFRGIDPGNQEDIRKCLHLIINDIPEDPEILEFCEGVQKTYPKTYLSGHSYGGLRANWVSRTMSSHPPAILLNPAQGFDPTYPSRFETQPQITTYHVIGDFVSRFAGLENPDGIHLVKVPEDMDKHGIKTFQKTWNGDLRNKRSQGDSSLHPPEGNRGGMQTSRTCQGGYSETGHDG